MKDKNSVININKPEGMTSQQAVTRVKHILSAGKAGHAGTLDPIATGILLVCINEATKITRFLTEADKEYIAVMKLGERTDTFDAEGKIIKKVEPLCLDEDRIKTVLEGFKGAIKQTPPMYSAIKVSGRPLYKLARKGMEVERPQKNVNIYELDMVRFEVPFLEIRVLCSKGTYIRALCDDIGTTLGVGAHITALRRTKTGDFRIEDSAEFWDLPFKEKSVCSIDTALKQLNDVILAQGEFLKAIKGMAVMPENFEELPMDSYLRLKNPEGKLFAIGKVAASSVRVERLLNILPPMTESDNS